MKLSKTLSATAIGLAAGLALAGTALAQSGSAAESKSTGTAGPQAGILTCKNVPGSRVNLLIHSSVDVQCTFKMADGKTEQYVGETGIGLGVDLNWNRDEEIAFSVISAGTDIRPGSHSLAGKYAGGKASATLGVGVGAAALIGGSSDNIALQPLAIETSRGLGVAAGLTYLYLEPAKKS